MARQAEAEWKGDLKGGSGRVKLGQRRVRRQLFVRDAVRERRRREP